MNTIDGLTYRQWQTRNTEFLKKLSPSQVKDVRAKGYKNVGWENVKKSWKIISNIDNVISLIDKRMKRGDIPGVIRHSILTLDKAIEYADESIQFAQDTEKEIEASLDKSKKIAKKALSKYKIL
ncbi:MULTISPECIES: hypothetical protein [unclassified Synechocystis]|uniref:hypothetical protein n=1 Tax=unclassified Synechocystis TaxID=2640012 RepID=UPI00040D7E20|nr:MULTISPECIES: hypothetical protein [unclassified Synechocystis]AIE74190.1 hypothetical protein D082_16620 [Synechocystis sp. PCC 6714]MCT0252822.1 hypothetical protein [Synechocystis sp. CS-94]